MFSTISRVHIATVGDFLGGNKVPIILDDKAFDQASETYDKNLHTAPTILGHATAASPSWGWVEKVYKEGADLFADLRVADRLKDWMSLALYAKRSASFYLPDSPRNPTPGKLHLRHLALLGAQPPVIKGLEDIANLAESDHELEPINWVELGLKIINLSEDQEEVFEVITNVAETVDSINQMIAEAEAQEIVDLSEAELAQIEAEAIAEAIAASEESVDLAETNADYVKNNIGTWMRYLLKDGTKGYKDEISRFDVEPALDNDWLWSESKQQFAGIFYDESYDPNKKIGFTLTRDKAGTWTRSFGLTADSAENADLSEDSTEAASDEIMALRAEVARLNQSIRVKEVTDLAEEIYSEGRLIEGVFPKSKLIALASSLEYQASNVDLSEDESVSQFDLLQEFLDTLPRQVMLETEIATPSEVFVGEVDLSELNSDAPVGTINDPEAYLLHNKAVKYCSENGLNAFNTDDYVKAVSAVF